MVKGELHIFQIGDVIVSPDIITEEFCCDLDKCKGVCCVEGDAGAPVTLDEIAAIEDALDTVWPDLSASAQAVIDRQGVAYTDRDGDLVTSIVGSKDCVFTCYAPEADTTPNGNGATAASATGPAPSDAPPGGCCLCALEKACRAGKTSFMKPISCALYPIREKKFAGGLYGINYNRWDVCKDAVKKGRELHLPLYRFLKGPLIRRFGEEWYGELCDMADIMLKG